MFEVIRSYFISWNAATSERQKLQHAYITLTVIGVLAAGLISLVNPKLGHRVVVAALFAFAIFLANAFVWNFLQSSFVSRISQKPKRK